MPTRRLERPHPTAAWDVNLAAMPPPAAGPEAAEDIPDERTVARSDPLVGLLRMQVSRQTLHHFHILQHPSVQALLVVEESFQILQGKCLASPQLAL